MRSTFALFLLAALASAAPVDVDANSVTQVTEKLLPIVAGVGADVGVNIPGVVDLDLCLEVDVNKRPSYCPKTTQKPAECGCTASHSTKHPTTTKRSSTTHKTSSTKKTTTTHKPTTTRKTTSTKKTTSAKKTTSTKKTTTTHKPTTTKKTTSTKRSTTTKKSSAMKTSTRKTTSHRPTTTKHTTTTKHSTTKTSIKPQPTSSCPACGTCYVDHYGLVGIHLGLDLDVLTGKRRQQVLDVRAQLDLLLGYQAKYRNTCGNDVNQCATRSQNFLDLNVDIVAQLDGLVGGIVKDTLGTVGGILGGLGL